MKRLLKAVFLVLPVVLLTASDLHPGPADAAQFCQTDGRRCFSEGQQFNCIYFGCCGFIGSGTCVCSGGFWSCPVPPECPPDFCP